MIRIDADIDNQRPIGDSDQPGKLGRSDCVWYGHERPLLAWSSDAMLWPKPHGVIAVNPLRPIWLAASSLSIWRVRDGVGSIRVPVPMTMMQVRIVRVTMHERCVAMPMAMRLACRIIRPMLVLMMGIVAMAVLMLQPFVGVLM